MESNQQTSFYFWRKNPFQTFFCSTFAFGAKIPVPDELLTDQKLSRN